MSKQKTYLSGSVRVKGGFWFARFRLPTGLDSGRKFGREWKKRGEEPPAGYDTMRTARRKLDEILAGYEGWTADSDPMFRFAAQEFISWCETEKKLRADSSNRYAQIISHDLNPVFGDTRLSEIEEDDIVELRDDLADRLAPSSVNQTRIVLVGIYKCARKKRRYRGVDASDWFDRVPMEAKTDIDVYSPEEVELLARTAQAGKYRRNPEEAIFPRRKLTESELAENRRLDDQNAAIFRTAAYTALRLSEIRQLRWRDVDFAGSKITVRKRYTNRDGENTPKSKKIRTVPMARRVAVELERLSRRGFSVELDELVFCNVFGERLGGSQIYKDYVACGKIAGLRRLRFQDLRHSAATMWIQKFDLRTVQEWLGHANIATTQIYLHYRERGNEAAQMDDLIESRLGAIDQFDQALEEVPDV